MKILILALVLLNQLSFPEAGDVRIKVYTKGASGNNIYLYTQPEPVTGKMKLIQKFSISEKEEFVIKAECDSICWYRLRCGADEYLFVLNGSGDYEMRLPEYRPLRPYDKMNPYFEYRLSHIKLQGGTLMNNEIRLIDSVYYDYAGKITESIYLSEKIRNSDSILHSFGTIRDNLCYSYSTVYFDCRLGLLGMIANRRTVPDSGLVKLMNRECLPLMPAYTELVDQIFNSYLKRVQTDNGEMNHIINSGGPYDDIAGMVREHGLICNDALLQYVVLKNLYDSYYLNTYRKEAVKKITGWLISNARDSFNRELAGSVLEKISRLEPGSYPPYFSLEDETGRLVSPDSLKGKYTILVFGNTALPDTRIELNILKSWVNEYSDTLQVVVVLLDEDFIPALERAGSENTDYIFLDGSDSEDLIDRYELKYLPAFFLLGTDSGFLISPAVLPSENLKNSVIRYIDDSLVNDIGQR